MIYIYINLNRIINGNNNTYSLNCIALWNPESSNTYKEKNVKQFISNFTAKKTQIFDIVPNGFQATIDETVISFISNILTKVTVFF